MPLKLAAGLAASVSFVAFALSAARIGAHAEDATPAPAAARPAAAAPAPATTVEPKEKKPVASRRRHVPPGILARAASKRAKDREPCAGASRAECERAQSTVESIEIDWHAQSSTP